MSLSLVKEVHRRLERIILKGDHCLDATAGNGFDSLFLAQKVGPHGTIHAIDIQSQALLATRSLLENHELSERVTTHLACHSQINSFLPHEKKGLLKACLFNLGYLPAGNKAITTLSASTLSALCSSYDWLQNGGVISILCYRGHAGGKEEEEEVSALIKSRAWKEERIEGNESSASPILHWVEKA